MIEKKIELIELALGHLINYYSEQNMKVGKPARINLTPLFQIQSELKKLDYNDK